MANCDICNNLTDAIGNVMLAELQSSAAQHCAGCTFLIDSILSFPEYYFRVYTLRWFVDRVLRLTLFDRSSERIAVLELYTDPGTTLPWKIVGPARAVSSRPWDPSQVQLARAWLRDCHDNHTLCQSPISRKLPTRVIDVGARTEDVHLWITQGQYSQYAALSHCWGGKTSIRTTIENMEDHQKNITFDESAKTFADAVQVTRDLGLQYLWIDSLCIIQNSQDDWVAESAGMAQVYQSAAVTISAETARNSSEGLFIDQEKRERHQVLRHFDMDLEASSKVTVHVRLRHSTSEDIAGMSHSSVERPATALSTRAWVLQERLLSTRLLLFLEEEFAWCCNSLSRCQCLFDAGLPVVSAFKNLNTNATRANKGTPDDRLGYELLQEWPQVVTDFTHRALTKDTDRLPALSGLAMCFNERTTRRYFAGLWESDLAYGLLWMSDHEHATDSKIRRYEANEEAPSWSWASIMGPISYIERHKTQFENQPSGITLKPLLDVLDASVDVNKALPFGSAGMGVILLSGQLLQVTYHPSQKVWRPRGWGTSSLRVEPQVVFDVFSESPAESGKDTSDYYFLRAAIYIKGISSSNSRENFCLLLRQVHPPDGSQSFGAATFSRRGVVLFGFGSAETWSLESLPKVLLCLV